MKFFKQKLNTQRLNRPSNKPLWADRFEKKNKKWYTRLCLSIEACTHASDKRNSHIRGFTSQKQACVRYCK